MDVGQALYLGVGVVLTCLVEIVSLGLKDKDLEGSVHPGTIITGQEPKIEVNLSGIRPVFNSDLSASCVIPLAICSIVIFRRVLKLTCIARESVLYLKSVVPKPAPSMDRSELPLWKQSISISAVLLECIEEVAWTGYVDDGSSVVGVTDNMIFHIV